MTLHCIHRYLIQSASEMLPMADRNRCRNPQSDTTKRALKHTAHWTRWKRRGKVCERQREQRTPREQSLRINRTRLLWTHRGWSSKHGPTQVYTAPLSIHSSLQHRTFVGLLNVWISGSLVFVPSLGAFPSLGCLVQTQCDGFCFVMVKKKIVQAPYQISRFHKKQENLPIFIICFSIHWKHSGVKKARLWIWSTRGYPVCDLYR